MFSVDVHWLVEDRVILGELCGDGDLDCCQRTLARIKELLDQSTGPVQLVLDMSRVTTPPKDPHQVFMAANRFRQHPNMKYVIVVTENPAIRMSGRVLAQFLGTPFQAVNTMSRALLILQRIDPSLKFAQRTAFA